VLPTFPLPLKQLKCNCATHPDAPQKLFSCGQGKLGQWIKTEALDDTMNIGLKDLDESRASQD